MSGALIQCIIVLYKERPIQSQSLTSLLRICENDPLIAARLKIMVQDNSPEFQPLPPGAYPCPVDYFHAPTNPGLADAYNRARAQAERDQIQWLLTLDQDTNLDRHFFLQLLAALDGEVGPQACAVVPQLVHDGLVLSPQIAGRVFYRRIPFGYCGFNAEPIVAFNSASCVNLAALAAMGGYPKEYWLDYLDHIVFHRLQASGGRIFILNSQLTHRLSLQNMESGVSIERYSNVLSEEWRFVRDSGAGHHLLIHRIRLLKRALMHALTIKDKRFALKTLRSAFM